MIPIELFKFQHTSTVTVIISQTLLLQIVGAESTMAAAESIEEEEENKPKPRSNVELGTEAFSSIIKIQRTISFNCLSIQQHLRSYLNQRRDTPSSPFDSLYCLLLSYEAIHASNGASNNCGFHLFEPLAIKEKNQFPYHRKLCQAPASEKMIINSPHTFHVRKAGFALCQSHKLQAGLYGMVYVKTSASQAPWMESVWTRSTVTFLRVNGSVLGGPDDGGGIGLEGRRGSH
ncbi:hypothetical protein HAX54_045007 [Datura stramonium]|uniref:Uncharacterized protein n=1 Tax=Datura stramonium TaxID=4076 RepID=A0ABS8WJB1_DATST|nr:hypothetical protein [Datura stramonium]